MFGPRTAVMALSATCLVACGAVRFDVEQALPEQKVTGSPLGGVLPSFLPNPFTVTIDVKAETQKRGTGPATAAYLKSLSLRATPASSPSGNFDFLDEIHIFIEASGQSKLEVATVKPVAKGLTTLTFTLVPEVNLLPFINAGATLSATATARQPTKDFTFDGDVVIDVRI